MSKQITVFYTSFLLESNTHESEDIQQACETFWKETKTFLEKLSKMQQSHYMDLIKLTKMKRKLNDCHTIHVKQNVQEEQNGRLKKRTEKKDKRKRSSDATLISIDKNADDIDCGLNNELQLKVGGTNLGSKS